jgi:acetate---CoA ligase (ADP-forming)
VLMADAAHKYALPVPPMPEAAQARLLETNPLASAVNPVDITAHAINDFDLVRKNLVAMLEDGGYDMLVSFFTSWPSSPTLGPKLREALRSGSAGHDRVPHALVVCGDAATLRPYEEEGFLVFEEPSRAVAALAALARIADSREAPARGAPPTLREPLPEIPARAVGEHEAKAILAAIGVPILPESLASDAASAVAAAERVGLPVAMKIVSPDIAHKSEIGGVALGVATLEAVEAAHARIMANAAKHAPDARIDGVLVSPMAGDGVELIVGARYDPVMGVAIMVGLGGIFVEVLRDVVLRRAPVDVEEALAMLEELNGAALLEGVRGKPPSDRQAAGEAIARLSVFAAANEGRFESIEINPLLVRREGEGAVALDALITPLEGGAP